MSSDQSRWTSAQIAEPLLITAHVASDTDRETPPRQRAHCLPKLYETVARLASADSRSSRETTAVDSPPVSAPPSAALVRHPNLRHDFHSHREPRSRQSGTISRDIAAPCVPAPTHKSSTTLARVRRTTRATPRPRAHPTRRASHSGLNDVASVPCIADRCVHPCVSRFPPSDGRIVLVNV
jgi:hypothetical protein